MLPIASAGGADLHKYVSRKHRTARTCRGPRSRMMPPLTERQYVRRETEFNSRNLVSGYPCCRLVVPVDHPHQLTPFAQPEAKAGKGTGGSC
jgi:hypothetical protein